MEPTPFNPKWFSHKFHGSGLRYEIGLCIRTGDIVWANGGLPSGQWSDLRIARSLILEETQPGEMIISEDIGMKNFSTFLQMNAIN